MNLNKTFILGNLTQNPEMRTTPSGQSVVSFSVATNRVWLDQNKQKKQQVEFHNIVAWGRLAEIINQYMTKGRLIMVEGRLQTRSWEGQDGIKRYRTEIIAENIQMGPQPGGAKTASSENSYTPTDNQANNVENFESPTPNTNTEAEIKVEDIPF
ncbi:MAG: single-stranded DNA-binding protein [Candidatus Buchananbacteria bacterium]